MNAPSGILEMARRMAPLAEILRPGRRRAVEAAGREWLGLQGSELQEAVRGAFVAELAYHLESPLAFSVPEMISRGQMALSGDRPRNGCVLALSHMGHHSFAGLLLHHLGWPVAELIVDRADLVGRLPDPRAWSALSRRVEDAARKRAGMRVFPATGSARAPLRALSAGTILIVPHDGRWGTDFVKVPFFRGRATFLAGPARLALLAGVPLVPAHMIRGSDGVFRLRLETPLVPPFMVRTRQPDARSWIEGAVATFARSLEAAVRADPGAYLWRLGALHRLQEAGRERFFSRK